MIIAPCIHFNICGGCSSQDLVYETQLLNKQRFIEEQFSTLALDCTILPIIASPKSWGYRNKMEFSFSQARQGERFLGLMMKRGRGKVVNLHECHLTHPWFIDTLEEVRKWWHATEIAAYYPPLNRGVLRNLTLRFGLRSGEKMVILTVAEDIEEPLLLRFQEAILKCQSVDALILRKQIVAKKCPTRFCERVLYGKDHIVESLWQESEKKYLHFKIRPSSFFQPNPFAAEIIYNKAIRLAAFSHEEKILDLYCGTGALGIYASSSVSKVIGIEQNGDAVIDAEENIRRNLVMNMEVFQGDVEKATFEEVQGGIQGVILDPPRVGLHPQALQKLIAVAPKKIVYISCNPVSQVDNIREFQKSGYHIGCVQPVDQFPHTPHVENIVVLFK